MSPRYVIVILYHCIIVYIVIVAKAFGAGADFVMMGGMLAGHDQSGGEVVFKIFFYI